MDKIQHFPSSDKILFNNKQIEINKDHFAQIPANFTQKSLAFIDGGQAEILSAGTFCLSLIRVGALIYLNNLKLKEYKHEFFLLTTAKHEHGEVVYESIIFPVQGTKIIDEQDLFISSADATIKVGTERASITQVANMARRFAELAVAARVGADGAEVIVLDGTLEPSFRNEEKYLSKLPVNICALAKSSSLFTISGNSPVVLLQKLSPAGCWSYFIEEQSYFVRLHEKSRHVFRFTGNKDFLSYLAENSTDALFLGYPYGLIAVDKFARVSNEEKRSLKMNFLLKADNREIAEYLSTTNAHDILDNLG